MANASVRRAYTRPVRHSPPHSGPDSSIPRECLQTEVYKSAVVSEGRPIHMSFVPAKSSACKSSSKQVSLERRTALIHVSLLACRSPFPIHRRGVRLSRLRAERCPEDFVHAT